MKVYISGPMSSIKDYNRPAFHKRAAELRERGYEVLNPAECDLGPDATWQDYMRRDIRMLMDADAIDQLDGWEQSKGATFEALVAGTVGIPVFEEA